MMVTRLKHLPFKMSLLNKEKPIGLDFIIDKIQTKLYNKLSDKWNIDLDAYPRCYVLEDQDGIVTVEHYERNKEYSGNLIVSERNKFFFTAEDSQEKVNVTQFETKLSIYFILDLKSIYPELKHRCDSEVLADVSSVLDLSAGVDRKYKIVTDYNEVFGPFFYEFDNIQPYYCFRIDLETLPYLINKIC